MTQTQNYRLPQWEKADRIVMADFNGMTGKIEAALTAHDAALAGKADKTTTNSLQTQINAKAAASALNSAVSALESKINGKCRLAAGAYTGDGERDRVISLGFTPAAVFVTFYNGWIQSGHGQYGGLAVAGSPAVSGANSDVAVIEVVTGGFAVHYSGSYQMTNSKDCKYHYIALG